MYDKISLYKTEHAAVIPGTKWSISIICMPTKSPRDPPFNVLVFMIYMLDNLARPFNVLVFMIYMLDNLARPSL